MRAKATVGSACLRSVDPLSPQCHEGGAPYGALFVPVDGCVVPKAEYVEVPKQARHPTGQFVTDQESPGVPDLWRSEVHS